MENNTDKIQDYIDGLLEGEELVHFESRMAVDDELRSLVALQKEVHEIINSRMDSNESELRSNLANARANISVIQNPRNKVFKIYIPIAAAVCLLVFFGLFLFKGADRALYELPTMQSEIVRGEVENTSYEDAVKAFNDGQYRESRSMLDGLIAEESTVVQYQYYAALTYIGEEDWEGAVAALQSLADGISIYADESKYYLGLAYWKVGDHVKAAEVLQRIPDSGKLGEKKAKLLKKINI